MKRIDWVKLSKMIDRWIDRVPATKRLGRAWTKRAAGIIAGIIILIVLFPLFSLKSDSMGEVWATAERGQFFVELVESGDIEAVSQLTISAPMMWGSQLQVIDLVPEGSMVKKGDILLHFDVSDLRDSKILAEDQLASLEADLEKLKAQQSLTISNMENTLKLSQYSHDQALLRLEMRKFESEAKKEEARLQLKQAEISLEKTKKQLASQRIIHASEIVKRETAIRHAQVRVQRYQDRIDMLQLTAPTDGMVVYTQVRGERVREGYTARPGWPLMTIPDLSHMQVKAYINEVDRMKIQVGQKAYMVLDAFPDLELQGKVVGVSRLAQNVRYNSKLKGFEVTIDIEGTDPRLKPGMTAKVRIILDTLEEVVYVPVGTVFEIDGQTVVFPKGSDKPHSIQVGPRNDAFVVVESGLDPGRKLSWTYPLDQAGMLGSAEEKKRIDEVNRTMRESFTVFEERGILHDYGTSVSEPNKEGSESKPSIDLDKLPPAIRQRLQEQGAESTTSEPKIEVGTPEGRQREGTFRVTPDMMRRLEGSRASDTTQTKSSSEK